MLFDLMAAAFQADVTRVFTFMMMRDVTSRSFPHIGVSDPHHALSHEANGRSNDPTKPVNFAKVNTHSRVDVREVRREAARDARRRRHAARPLDGALRQRAWATPTITRTIRCRTVVLGGGGGQMKALDITRSYPGESMANLLLALAQKAGAQTERFGVSTEPLDI